MKHIQDDIVSLRTKVDSSKVNTEEKLEDFKDSFGKILSEVQNVYKVAEKIHERINQLVDNGNRRFVDDGSRRFDIIVFIREGISRREEQQKFKLVTIKDDNLELKENIVSNHHNIKSFNETFVVLRKDLLSLQDKVESIEVNFKAIEQNKFQMKSLILQMQTEKMRELKDIFTRLQPDHNGVKDELEEIKKHLKETFGKTFEKIKEVNTVS
ncbi:unnamed protein product [Mytilus coruscus]|uniref:Uncharacterized protein n=1 Tax=Mytilus coruscus TaxID=42192 RepID=A0A6J8E9S1_MYTCO|nr:unnamed protein product [Mytilus coruscus]